MRRTRIVLLISCLLAACSTSENAASPLPDVSAVRLNLAFARVHEVDHLPPLDPATGLPLRGSADKAS